MNNINSNKEVLSFMIYMWNAWSFNECMFVFDGETDNEYDIAHHIWNKYLSYSNKYGLHAAISMLVAELDEDKLDNLIKRACSLYYGRSNR